MLHTLLILGALVIAEPYRLHVAVHFAPQRDFTPAFQAQTKHDLRDHLSQHFGKEAHVAVDSDHPLLGSITSGGLQAVLDGHARLGPRQDIFILIDQRNGFYELEARGYDETTAQAGPRILKARTPDRGLVGKLAGQLAHEAFRPTGIARRVGKEVELTPTPGIPITAGDVWAVVRIAKEGPLVTARRLPWTLLETKSQTAAGAWQCKLWHRYQEDDLAESPGLVEYRAIRIPTTQTPVRVRFLDAEKPRPLDGLEVHVLSGDLSKKVELVSGNDGLITTREPFRHLAIVRVMAGSSVRAELPIELIDDRTVLCRLKIAPEAEGQAAWMLRRDQWLRRLYDHVLVVNQRVREQQNLLLQSLDASLSLAKRDRGSLAEEIGQLAQEEQDLLKLAPERKIANARVELQEGNQRLLDMRFGLKKLDEYIARIEGVLKNAPDEQAVGLTKMLERARLLEVEASFPQAIALYRTILAASPEQKQIAAHLHKIESAWAPLNDAHTKARQFLYEVWPGLDVPELKTRIDEAQKAFAVCQASGDKLGMMKFLRVNLVHAAQLKRRLDQLKQQDTEDNRNQARALFPVADALRTMHAEATAFLGK